MGGSRGDVFINQFRLYQESSYKKEFTLGGGLTPYLTLESNEYQSCMLKFVSKLSKNYAIFRGEVIKSLH